MDFWSNKTQMGKLHVKHDEEKIIRSENAEVLVFDELLIESGANCQIFGNIIANRLGIKAGGVLTVFGNLEGKEISKVLETLVVSRDADFCSGAYFSEMSVAHIKGNLKAVHHPKFLGEMKIDGSCELIHQAAVDGVFSVGGDLGCVHQPKLDGKIHVGRDCKIVFYDYCSAEMHVGGSRTVVHYD